MKLDLVNFKRFQKASFVFDSKCILLHGPSGAGKTTLMAAIAFAFTGQGKKVVKHGKTKCSVTLTLPEMIITRTKGPCRLLVEKRDNGVTYEDSEGQAFIQRVFPNWEFGYVSQRLYKSFILMTPSDKLAIIERMALSGINIEELQNKCKQLISQRKESLLKTERERSTIETLLKEIGCFESSKKDRDSKQHLQLQLQSLTTEYNAKCSAISQYTNHVKKLLELGRKKDKLENDLSNTPSYKDVDIDLLQSQTTKYNRYVAEQKHLKRDLPHSGMTETELDTIIDDMKKLVDLDIAIRKYASCERDLQQLNNFKQTHVVTIGNCPNCKELIGSWNGTLLIPDKDKLSTTVQESEYCEQQRLKLMASIETLNELKQQRTDILKFYDGGIEDVDKHLRHCKEVRINDRVWEKCNEFVCEKPTMDLITIMGCINRYENVKHELDVTTREYQKLLDTPIGFLDIGKENTAVVELSQRIENIETELKNCDLLKQWDKVSVLRAKQECEEKLLPAAIRLQSLVRTAEQIVLNETLNNINARAANYLQRFFSNNDMTALLVFEGQKIELLLKLDDCETDINSLSGGEFARVVLAFAITMAEMNDIKTLMLDESFASLDADTTENVLETIKENFAGNIIIIAHQTTTGVFDQVLRI